MRLWIGIFLLVFLLLLGIGASVLMPRFHDPIAAGLQNAADLCAAGDSGKAYEVFLAARARWERYHAFTESVCDHQPQDAMDALFAATDHQGKAGQWEDFGAGCAQLAAMAKELRELHGLSLSQIL